VIDFNSSDLNTYAARIQLLQHLLHIGSFVNVLNRQALVHLGRNILGGSSSLRDDCVGLVHCILLAQALKHWNVLQKHN